MREGEKELLGLKYSLYGPLTIVIVALARSLMGMGSRRAYTGRTNISIPVAVYYKQNQRATTQRQTTDPATGSIS
jgi:hypothetical protein